MREKKFVCYPRYSAYHPSLIKVWDIYTIFVQLIPDDDDHFFSKGNSGRARGIPTAAYFIEACQVYLTCRERNLIRVPFFKYWKRVCFSHEGNLEEPTLVLTYITSQSNGTMQGHFYLNRRTYRSFYVKHSHTSRFIGSV